MKVPNNSDDVYDVKSDAPKEKIFEQKYDLPEEVSSLVDVNEGKVVEAKDVKPIDVIKALARRYKWDISDPSKGCHKCYGRGYEGKNADGSPVPCRCLFRKRNNQERQKDDTVGEAYKNMNRSKRRKLIKYIHKKINDIKRNNPEIIQKVKEDVINNLSASNISSAADEVQENILNVDVNTEISCKTTIEESMSAEQDLDKDPAENELNHQNS